MRRALIPTPVAAGLLAATTLVDGLVTTSTRLSAESKASEVAEVEARQLEQTLLLYVSAVDGLTAFIESQDRDRRALAETFDSFSASLADASVAMKSVQIVLDSRMEFVRPVRGNERAVGLDVFADPPGDDCSSGRSRRARRHSRARSISSRAGGVMQSGGHLRRSMSETTFGSRCTIRNRRYLGTRQRRSSFPTSDSRVRSARCRPR